MVSYCENQEEHKKGVWIVLLSNLKTFHKHYLLAILIGGLVLKWSPITFSSNGPYRIQQTNSIESLI